MDRREYLECRFFQDFVEKAKKHGFTKGDTLWCILETKKEYMIESRRQPPRPGLLLDILREKVKMMVMARRIVKELCEELGIKTE